MFKKIMIGLAVVFSMFLFTNTVFAQALSPVEVGVDTVSTSPVSFVSAFGTSFVTSSDGGLQSTGLSKAGVFLYRVNPSFSLGANYSGIDFQAENLTEADIEAYGIIGIYHRRFSELSKFGWYVKGNVGIQNINAGEFELMAIIGPGVFYNINERFGLVAGADPVYDNTTSTYGVTTYVGLETNLR